MYEWTVGPSPAAVCSHVVETWLLQQQQQQRCQLTGYKWYINRSWLDKVSRFGDKERPDLWAEAEISRISYYA
ncbi:hypothetical protein CHARACLAT_017906, partial [Characodon lateralis]|nr:hypothetical protein [Characodon lateralis]